MLISVLSVVEMCMVGSHTTEAAKAVDITIDLVLLTLCNIFDASELKGTILLFYVLTRRLECRTILYK